MAEDTPRTEDMPAAPRPDMPMADDVGELMDRVLTRLHSTPDGSRQVATLLTHLLASLLWQLQEDGDWFRGDMVSWFYTVLGPVVVATYDEIREEEGH